LVPIVAAEIRAGLADEAWSVAAGRSGLFEEGYSVSSAAEKSESWRRVLGLGIVTGAADDDCSAIGTYASAGAQFGLSFLWTAPITFPMMFAVVYLSSKLGQVTGKGLFQVVKERYPKWVLWPMLVGVLRKHDRGGR
jgi:Mn2+/Fe2+ NRAMP family transporter